MKPEIEVKFLNVDHEGLRRQLELVGAALVAPLRTMRRYNYDYPDRCLQRERKGWVRLRDEGDGVITLTYKQLNDRSLTGMHESLVRVDDFTATDVLLQQIGLERKSLQVTRRESWTLDGCEIELDEWPWVKPSLEIEGPDEQAIKAAAETLDLAWKEATFGSVEVAYTTEYDVTDDDVNSWNEIDFTPVPDWLEAKRR